jgi:predicted TIM-barrel fold metal-dependent hydrolase
VSGWASTRPVTAEQLIAAMDSAGVAKAALVQASTAYGYDNRYVLDTAARFPDRFTAVGCVDPLAEDVAVTIAELADDPNLSGIRLFTTGSTMPGQADWLNDAATYPFWTAVERARLPVCVQMKIAAKDQLIDILERFPNAPIVLDHMAYPSISAGNEAAAFEQLAALAPYRQLTLKMTMRNTEPLASVDAAAFLNPLVDAFGSDRIAWGSNYPAAPQSLDELLDLARKALSVLGDDDRENILGATAARLYPALQ